MPITIDPEVADDVAAFGTGSSKAASINYDVPLPGAYSWQRIVPLEIPEDWFESASTTLGTSLEELGVIQVSAEGQVLAVDGSRLSELYKMLLPSTARPSLRLAADAGTRITSEVPRPPDDEAAPQQQTELLRSGDYIRTSWEDVVVQQDRREGFIEGLAESQVEEAQAVAGAAPISAIVIPAPGLGESIQPVSYDIAAAGFPRLALVETWELRSSLGDYGLGRTLQTFSLLPGERTTITIETWRTEAATREDASSIFDSSDVAAQTRFTSALSQESGLAFQDQGGWAMSVGTKVGGGASLFGLASFSMEVEAGFAANHQESRQMFARNTSTAAQEHASQVNNSRRQAVESSSTTQTASGTETTTAREIANTNLRRVLNFVFRELNQTYETLTVLRDVRVAFYNGNPGSVEIVPLAELRKLLARHVVPDQQEEVARVILTMAAECIDETGTPVTTLESGTRPDGNVYEWQDATLGADGTIDFDDSPLDAGYSWRFKPGKLGEANDDADGVVTGRSSIVLRTDNVVVEALLGQADALDPYATEVQALDVEARRAEIEARNVDKERVEKALEIIDAQPAGDQTDAFEKMLGDHPDIAVVPAAAVTDNNPNP